MTASNDVKPVHAVRRSAAAARALSMVEAVVSIVIVGVMLVAALNAVGGSMMTQKKMGDHTLGELLAQDLLSEILSQEYEDPDLPPGSFGTGAAEAATGNRSLYDDVDDYHNWSASPPQKKDGSVIPGLSNWRRTVLVAWVSSNDYDNSSLIDTRFKKIIVTVRHNGGAVASLTAIRTAAMDFYPDRE